MPNTSRFLHFIIGFGLLIMATGCGKTSDSPRQPLPKEKLIAILMDLELAEARLMTLRDVKPAMRDSLLKDHRIPPPVFEAWMTYYAGHPELFLPIREEVSRRLAHEAPNVPTVSPTPIDRLTGR